MRYSEALAGLGPISAGYLPPAPGQVKLNQNESPFDMAPEDRAALAEALCAVSLRRYPDPRSRALTAVIADAAGVAPDMVLPGNGANELIELLIRATCDAGDQVLTVGPTYHLYDRFAALNRAELVKVAWGEDFAFPRAELRGRIGPRARLLLLCRPNNPTGHLWPSRDVLDLADGFPGMVVVDEAYYDFCRDTVAPFVGGRGNLVVVRTLSKAYGAAGLRLGYLLGPADVVRAVRGLQMPYGLNAFSQEAARFLLSRPDLVERRRAAILAYREDLALRLEPIPGVTAYPSAANFLLIRTDFSADALDRHLQGADIFVRNLRWDDRHLRISVGTPADHARLAAAMRAFASPGPAASA